MKPQPILLALTVLVSSLVPRAQEKNAFEARHAQSEAKNPPGLSMVLDTPHGKRSYSEGEYIPLVISYASDVRYKYKIETGFGWNAVAESQRLYTDEQITPVVCVVSRSGHGQRFQPLNSQPVVVPHCIHVRLKPGEHEVYVTAMQVFPWSTAESGKGFLTTSNILRLDITPDPGWQERDLARTMRDYDKHPTASCGELSTLDIPEATAEKLKLLDGGGHCRVSFHPTEYETAQRTIEQWIRDPDHTVTDSAVDALATVRASMNHPELLTGWLDDSEKQQANGHTWISALETSKTELAKEMCSTLPTKIRSVQISTRKNICEVLTWQPSVEDAFCSCRDTTKH